MKFPRYAFLLLGRNTRYPIEKINISTKLVTLRENEKVYNTVSVRNVRFDYSDFTEDEINKFQELIS